MTPGTDIAIIGMACRYPDATTPEQLWENVLACRRAFRTMPAERLGNEYFSNPNAPAEKDKIVATKVALLKGYSFDRARFNIPASNFRTADLCHWLALEVAADAIRQSSIENLPKAHKRDTGVIVGNTLTGEFVRSNILRLRWPYVRKTAKDAMAGSTLGAEAIDHILEKMEKTYKSAFPPMEEDSLAGGLSNTIAGRICNYYDLKGGGYTVDGACSSSLLAVCKACDAISSGQLSIAIVGGVDISLDPFELVGFSRAGALSTEEMRIYDKRSNGFWPGEGCGFAVLASQDLVQEYDLPVLAVIKGWGISSDGKGGLTRPEVEGQYLALKRAYAKADYGLDSIAYVEGHGTGTAMGDEVEISALLKMLPDKDPQKTICLGSVKANIGHTKAASGMAGMIKAVMAIRSGVIPPITGNTQPHRLLEASGRIVLPRQPIPWNSPDPLRVGVSSMGFGGINTHITLEGPEKKEKRQLTPDETRAASTPQDTELFLLSADSKENLIGKIRELITSMQNISLSELTDLSHTLYSRLRPSACRLAIEAATPGLLSQRLQMILLRLEEASHSLVDTVNGLFFSDESRPPRIGFLFPGQGTGLLEQAGLLFRRWPFLRTMLPENGTLCPDNRLDTHQAQLSAVGAAIMGIQLLQKMNVAPAVLVGHSVGELAALYAAGFADQATIMRLTSERGRLMQDTPAIRGGMLSIPLEADSPLTKQLLEEEKIDLAAVNGPKKIVLSGKKEALQTVQQRCRNLHVPSVFLEVENAFHSSQLAILRQPWKIILEEIWPSGPQTAANEKGKIYSTVTGEAIQHRDFVPGYLVRQLTEPVLFFQAFQKADEQVDCWIEVGKGTTLQKLTADTTIKPVVSLDLSGDSVKGVLQTAGLLFSYGYPISLETIMADRFFREFDPAGKPQFIANPCESNPGATPEHPESKVTQPMGEDPIRPLFKAMLAEKLELPAESIGDTFRMLDDLHLNSLYVVELLMEFSEKFNFPVTGVPMEYANASVEEIVCMFSSAAEKGKGPRTPEIFDGIAAWVHPFRIHYKEIPLPPGQSQEDTGRWLYLANKKTPTDRPGLPRPHGTGILIQLYSDDEPGILDVLDSLTDLLRHEDIGVIVVVQQSSLVTAFCKTLFLEMEKIKMLIITDPSMMPDTGLLAREIACPGPFSEVVYSQGKRKQPFLMPALDLPRPVALPSVAASTFLVTGGAKGITFECARMLGRQYGCKLILIGRSDPAKDAEAGRNIRGLQQEHIDVVYYRLDISDAEKTRSLMAEIQQAHGPVTGILHGAGVNTPTPIRQLSREKIRETLAPKLYGLRHLLAGIDFEQLRYCFTFGSFLAATGMEGNADYTLANEWLREEVRQLKTAHPSIYFLNIEWSVWAGTGMGQYLGVLERLIKRGIAPISLDNGLAFLAKLFESPVDEPNIIVTGRFPALPTCQRKSPALQPLRYLEVLKVFYPGIELVAEFSLSPIKDPYLTDHVFNGQPIFPGVAGLEAMAEAARCLLGSEFPGGYCLRDVEFLHPIIINGNQEKKCRVIAQRKDRDSVAVVIREEESSYLVDHLRLTFVITHRNALPPPPVFNPAEDPGIDMKKDVYGQLLFHGKSFQTIQSYSHLTPYSCTATGRLPAKPGLYSDFLPQQTILLHPLLHDAAFQVVQACVPHQKMLPIAIEECSIGEERGIDRGSIRNITIHAREVRRLEDLYIYDIWLLDEDGGVIEEMRSVSFKVVREAGRNILPLSLIKMTLLRKVHQLTGRTKGLTVEFNPTGDDEMIYHRPDGRPLLLDNSGISRSYLEEDAMVVRSPWDRDIACDIEKVTQHDAPQWKKILGEERFRLSGVLQEKTREGLSVACTRIWGAAECIRKSGSSLFSPLSLSAPDRDGCVNFSSGDNLVVSFHSVVAEYNSPVIFTILIPQGNAPNHEI